MLPIQLTDILSLFSELSTSQKVDTRQRTSDSLIQLFEEADGPPTTKDSKGLESQKGAGESHLAWARPGTRVKGLVIGRQSGLDLVQVEGELLKARGRAPLPKGATVTLEVVSSDTPIKVRLVSSQSAESVRAQKIAKAFLGNRANMSALLPRLNHLLAIQGTEGRQDDTFATENPAIKGLISLVKELSLGKEPEPEKIKALVFFNGGKGKGPITNDILQNFIQKTRFIKNNTDPGRAQVASDGHAEEQPPSTSSPPTGPETPEAADINNANVKPKDQFTKNGNSDVTLPFRPVSPDKLANTSQHPPKATRGPEFFARHITSKYSHDSSLQGNREWVMASPRKEDAIVLDTLTKGKGENINQKQEGAPSRSLTVNIQTSVDNMESGEGASKNEVKNLTNIPFKEGTQPQNALKNHILQKGLVLRDFSNEEVEPLGKKVVLSREETNTSLRPVIGHIKDVARQMQENQFYNRHAVNVAPMRSKKRDPLLDQDDVGPGSPVSPPSRKGLQSILDGLQGLTNHLENLHNFRAQVQLHMDTPFFLIPFWFANGSGLGHVAWWQEDPGDDVEEKTAKTSHLFFDLELKNLGPITIQLVNKGTSLRLNIAARKDSIKLIRAGFPILKEALEALDFRLDLLRYSR